MDKYTLKDIDSSLDYLTDIKSTIEDLKGIIETLEEEIKAKDDEIEDLRKQLN